VVESSDKTLTTELPCLTQSMPRLHRENSSYDTTGRWPVFAQTPCPTVLIGSDCLEIIGPPKKVLIFVGRLAYDPCGIFVTPDPQGKECLASCLRSH
jgi:hypothetical protein